MVGQRELVWLPARHEVMRVCSESRGRKMPGHFPTRVTLQGRDRELASRGQGRKRSVWSLILPPYLDS